MDKSGTAPKNTIALTSKVLPKPPGISISDDKTINPDLLASRISERSEKEERLATRRELICNLRDAVVNISCHTYLKPEGITIRHGNGFFIKHHYILCPASLILAPYGKFIDNAREPPYNGLPTNHKHPNEYIRCSRILVTVSNINNKTLVYEADIIGLDGAANIAVIKIPNEEFGKQPYLEWGKSRNAAPGDDVFAIGSVGLDNQKLTGLPGNGVIIGNIANNRYVHPSGQIAGELLLLSSMLISDNYGLPIVGLDGKFIGMVVASEAIINIALSEFFVRRSVKAIISHNQAPTDSHAQLQTVPEPLGNYDVFTKGWLGLCGYMMSADDYYSNIDYDTLLRTPSIVDTNVEKEIIGYRVTRLILNTNSNLPTFPPSPLIGLIQFGDIITHINDCQLGDRKGQVAPALVMWRVKPNDLVKIKYKKRTQNYKETHELKVFAGAYPPILDYPFYVYDMQRSAKSMLITLM